MFFVYMIRNNWNRLYVGTSSNPEKRLRDHHKKQGAYFTKTGVFHIVFKEEYPTLREARQREVQIKKWSRVKKDVLIERHKKGLPTKIEKKED